ncbi:MAG: cyclodeaminase/cyclohydrolase family protein [Bacteroidetes bacterium]|nr:cyclodeaminase/cyclohydrolase family protein [Bacteroidota bacterium]
MELQKSLQNYFDELTSSSPTPGGGNVAALCGVLASSLGEMVCNLTIGKKKYLDFETDAKELLTKFESFKKDFLTLAERDNEAFDRVMDAFKLSKKTEAQKAFRNSAIDHATLEAALVPEEVIIKCKELLPHLEKIAEKGNQNSLSDSGVAISLTAAAAEGAFLNVAINCSGLSNQVTAKEFLKKSEFIYHEIKEKSAGLISQIIKRMTTK